MLPRALVVKAARLWIDRDVRVQAMCRTIAAPSPLKPQPTCRLAHMIYGQELYPVQV